MDCHDIEPGWHNCDDLWERRRPADCPADRVWGNFPSQVPDGWFLWGDVERVGQPAIPGRLLPDGMFFVFS